jgi:hypothetical protein
LQQSWDAGSGRVRGTTETIAGEPYAIWIQVPQRYRVARVRAVQNAGTEIPLEKESVPGALTIRFAGQGRPVDWEVQFAGG